MLGETRPRLVERAFEHLATAIENQEPRGEFLDQREQVRRENHGRARAREFLDLMLGRANDARVYPRERLYNQDKRGSRPERGASIRTRAGRAIQAQQKASF